MADSRNDASPDPGGRRRKVPPLAWIIVGLLALCVAIAFALQSGTHVTPNG